MNEKQVETLKKLEAKYSNAPFTALFKDGKFDDAAVLAAKYGMWGLFHQMRTNTEVSNDDAFGAMMAEINAAKKAKYAKR
jgi:hypothetical protein